MKLKILVCKCSLAKLEENQVFVFQPNHFHCHCFYGREFNNVNLHSEYLVALCDKDRLLSNFFIQEKYYTCYKVVPFDICTYCVNVLYLLNFK